MRKAIVYCIYGMAFLLPLFPNIADLLLLVAFVMAIAHYLFSTKEEREKSSRGARVATVFLYAYGIWSALSIFNSKAPYFSSFNWLYMVGMGLGIYQLSKHYVTTEDIQKKFFGVAIGGGIITCLYGLYVYSGIPIVETKEWVDSAQFPLLQRRMYSTLQNPNLMGLYLLELLAITSPLALLWKKVEKTWLWWSASILFFICLLLTYSRGVWIAFALMVVYWGFKVEKRLFWSLFVIPVVLFYYRGGIATRLWSLFESGDTSVSLRYALWDSTWAMVQDHPLLGVGWGDYFITYPFYNYFIQDPEVVVYHAHHMYLRLAATIGIPGVVFFVAFLMLFAYTAARIDNRYCQQNFKCILNPIYSYGMPAMILAILISGVTDYNLFSHQLSLITWQFLGVGMAAIVDKD